MNILFLRRICLFNHNPEFSGLHLRFSEGNIAIGWCRVLLSIRVFLPIVNNQKKIIQRRNKVEANCSFLRKTKFKQQTMFFVIHQIWKRFSIFQGYFLSPIINNCQCELAIFEALNNKQQISITLRLIYERIVDISNLFIAIVAWDCADCFGSSMNDHIWVVYNDLDNLIFDNFSLEVKELVVSDFVGYFVLQRNKIKLFSWESWVTFTYS